MLITRELKGVNKKIMNYEALTTELSNLYLDLKAGKIEPKLARELNNTAINIQSTVRLGLLNAKLKDTRPT